MLSAKCRDPLDIQELYWSMVGSEKINSKEIQRDGRQNGDWVSDLMGNARKIPEEEGELHRIGRNESNFKIAQATIAI